MKVFIVYRHIHYEASDNQAVFSTLEAAQQYIVENNDVEQVNDYRFDQKGMYSGISYGIDEFDMDNDNSEEWSNEDW